VLAATLSVVLSGQFTERLAVDLVGELVVVDIE